MWYFVNGTRLNVVEPRTWKIVRTVRLPRSRVLGIKVVGQRSRRVFVASRFQGADGAVDKLIVLCADARCS